MFLGPNELHVLTSPGQVFKHAALNGAIKPKIHNYQGRKHYSWKVSNRPEPKTFVGQNFLTTIAGLLVTGHEAVFMAITFVPQTLVAVAISVSEMNGAQ